MDAIKTNKLLNMSHSTVGPIIKRLRQINGLTQKELGEKVGVSSQQVQKYERGKDNVPIPRLRIIAQIFNIHVSHFFPEEETAKDEKSELFNDFMSSISKILNKFNS